MDDRAHFTDKFNAIIAEAQLPPGVTQENMAKIFTARMSTYPPNNSSEWRFVMVYPPSGSKRFILIRWREMEGSINQKWLDTAYIPTPDWMRNLTLQHIVDWMVSQGAQLQR